ncbi:MAG TPA: hypothetical protein VGA35_11160 [bacterium]
MARHRCHHTTRGSHAGRPGASLGLTIGLAVASLVLGGCGAQTATAPPSAPASRVRPQSTATVAITAPVPGAEVPAGMLHVRIRLTGGEIIPQTSTQLSPDKGHIHLILDGKVVSMAYGVEQDVEVTTGLHLLQTEFVATDHFPFNPRVISAVTFTVK